MIIVIKIENAHRREEAPQTCACKKEHLQNSTNERKAQVNPIFADILSEFFGEVAR